MAADLDPPPPEPALAITPGPLTASDYVPAETAPPSPDLLAALDAGDEEAVWAWFRANAPERSSLAFYGLLTAAGLAGLVEWPALALTALGQLIVDRRFGGVENLAAELRARVEGLSRPA